MPTIDHKEASITGKITIDGTLEALSPLCIGGERGGLADVKILRDKNGRPFIPGSTLAGVLLDFFKAYYDISDNVIKEQANFFWGEKINAQDRKSRNFQSAFAINDAVLNDNSMFSIATRDGVAIDSRTGIVDGRKKFDYEVLEPSAKFAFRAEVTLRSCFDKSIFEDFIAFLVGALVSSQIWLGSGSNKGFGQVGLSADYKYCCYDFTDKSAVLNWLNRAAMPGKLGVKESDISKVGDFCMTAGFCIKSSLIVRNYSQLESPADSVQLTSREKPIVPGSSIRGAMRARAERIVRALGARHLQITKTLFGYAETDSNDKRKGKLRIEESALKECDKQIQCRTKIDRFTGGTIDGALFNSEAMWSQSPTDENLTLKLSCRSCVEAEAGLILLLLKDLWTGDLPLGGEKAIGRGVLQGLYAELNYAGQTVKLAQTAEGKLQISEAGLLEKWVTALVEECGKGDAYNA